MAERITKAQRWLDLVVFLLRHHFPVSVEQIMEAVPAYADDWACDDETRQASVRRKFERDKDELRGLGIPIDTVKYTVNYGVEELDGYRLEPRDLYLPKLHVELAGEGGHESAPRRTGAREVSATPQMWSALARAAHRVAELPESPLAPHGRSALRKLGFDLPELADSTEEPFVHYLGVPDPDVTDALRALTPALLARKEVRFIYYSIGKDERRERCAHPFGLMYQGGAWYLIARDPEADGIRTFRVSRMSEVSVNDKSPKSADYEVPPQFRLRDHVGREAWRLGEDGAEEITAEVLFLPPTSWWAESQALGEYLREDQVTGGQLRGFRVRQLDPFLRWCLSFQGQVRPIAPESAASGFRELAERVLALYQDDAGREDGD